MELLPSHNLVGTCSFRKQKAKGGSTVESFGKRKLLCAFIDRLSLTASGGGKSLQALITEELYQCQLGARPTHHS